MVEKNCKCLKCGHNWTKRIDKPNACPRCNNKKWFEKKRSYIIRQARAEELNKEASETSFNVKKLPKIDLD